MDDRAIGVFDSGLGGLTAVAALRELLPDEDVVYFGDTGRVPYGTRSVETIERYAAQDVRFLLGEDIKCIVVACGTVSSVALPGLFHLTEVPVLGVIDAAVEAAAAATRSGRIGVVGTNATIKSGTYRRGLLEKDSALQVVSQPCPLLVPVVEDGRFAPGSRIAELLVEEYVAPLLQQEVDTIILGCTHYPLLAAIFRQVCGEGVTLIDPGYETIRKLSSLLTRLDMKKGSEGRREQYYVSDSEQQFLQLAEMFLGGRVAGRVQRVDIERY
ncbi:MAG: glutamate racemase [Clostridia bacterium]|nr:glutamate racemase [Clostridia bacterium]MBQ3078116.1 glutamate racemase [Clostridia bacterium]